MDAQSERHSLFPKIEPYAGRFLLHAEGAQQRGQRPGYAIQQGRPLALFELDRLPVLQHLVDAADDGVAEHVRVAPDQLFGNAANDVA